MSLYPYFIVLFFQFTTSQGGRPEIYLCIFIYVSFNSRPHKEVDRKAIGWPISRKAFNSRPHKEVDLVSGRNLLRIFLFQFTTSQGGRLSSHGFLFPIYSFNSRPHKEVDYSCSICIYHRGLSIHDLTRRSTFLQLGRMAAQSTFNSRPHKEVDPAGSAA